MIFKFDSNILSGGNPPYIRETSNNGVSAIKFSDSNYGIAFNKKNNLVGSNFLFEIEDSQFLLDEAYRGDNVAILRTNSHAVINTNTYEFVPLSYITTPHSLRMKQMGYNFGHGLNVTDTQSGGVTNYAALQRFANLTKIYRGAKDDIGDSNQNFNGYGFKLGEGIPFLQKYGCWGTGLIRASGNSGNALGRVPSTNFTNTGIPEELGIYAYNSYCYLASGSANINSNGGYVVFDSRGGIIDPGLELRFRLNYGLFEAGTPSDFSGKFRRATTPFTSISTSSPTVTPVVGEYGLATYEHTIAANAERSTWEGIQMFWNTLNQPFSGPVFVPSAMVDVPEKTNGVAAQVHWAEGGASLRKMLEGMLDQGSERLAERYRQTMVGLSGDRKPFLIRINSGVNDMNETGASLGPNPVSDGDSPEAFEDNLRGIMEFTKDAWIEAGGNEEDLFYLLIPSHPIASSEDSDMVGYRAVAKAMAKENPNVSTITLPEIGVTHAALTAGGYYDSGGNAHLTQAGYDWVGSKIVSVLPD